MNTESEPFHDTIFAVLNVISQPHRRVWRPNRIGPSPHRELPGRFSAFAGVDGSWSPSWCASAGSCWRTPTASAPTEHNFGFGFETGRIAYSLAHGMGFSSPFGGNTGPSAWTAPVYPWIVSLAFRAFGSYSPASAFAMLTFNSIFGALTSWTIYRTARRDLQPERSRSGQAGCGRSTPT